MKKNLYKILLVFGILIFQILAMGKMEAAQKTPLDSDKNFAYIESHMGVRSYVDLRTVKILRNDPPYFSVSGNIVLYSVDRNKVYKTSDSTHFYDALAYKTYVKNKSTGGDWSKDDVKLDSARRYADAFFKAAFGREFYGKNFRVSQNLHNPVRNLEYARIALGGIQYGSDKNRVRSIYGNPDKIKEYDSRNTPSMYEGYVEEWTYGNSFEIIFENGIAIYVHSSGKNGIKTPDGIAVGDDVRKLYRTYGTAESTSGFKDGVSYIYRNDDNDVCMAFWVKDDRIVEIRILIE